MKNMKYLESFINFRKKKNTEYTGKTETYRFKNIHKNEKGDVIGTCKHCDKEVQIAEHETCEKMPKD